MTDSSTDSNTGATESSTATIPTLMLLNSSTDSNTGATDSSTATDTNTGATESSTDSNTGATDSSTATIQTQVLLNTLTLLYWLKHCY